MHQITTQEEAHKAAQQWVEHQMQLKAQTESLREVRKTQREVGHSLACFLHDQNIASLPVGTVQVACRVQEVPRSAAVELWVNALKKQTQLPLAEIDKVYQEVQIQNPVGTKISLTMRKYKT